MSVEQQIDTYLNSLPESRRNEMIELHHLIMPLFRYDRLWFLDGKDKTGKVVSNPNIGYGSQIIESAGGKSKEFYRVGISANTTGISVYILNIRDKSYLRDTFGKDIGKATVTGYCIKFRSLKDIRLDVLISAARAGAEGGR